MFKNQLKVALRHLLKQQLFSGINMASLALGIASCMLITLYVQEEFSYDQFHQNKDRIYRLAFDLQTRSGTLHLAAVAPAVGPALQQAFPGLEKFVRLYLPGAILVSFGEKRFYEDKVLVADSSLFEVFTFPLLRGNMATALKQPDDIVITSAMAQKYFGAEDPIGQTLVLDNRLSFKVVAVAREVPSNSHFSFDFLVPFTALSAIREQEENDWGWSGATTYFLATSGFAPARIEALLPDFLDRQLGATRAARWRLYFQPLADVYLHSNLSNEIGPTSNVRYAYAFFVVALFILAMACINFVNLATARSTERAREVGVRKVLGARRSSLLRQFLTESIIVTMLAVILGVMLVELALPGFNTLVQKQLRFEVLHNLQLFGGVLLGGLVLGSLAGGYPALVLSSFSPVVSLSGGARARASGAGFRRGLVVAQFAIAIALLSGMLIAGRQLAFMRNKNLGFSQEQVVVLPLRDEELNRRAQLIGTELQKNARVLSVARSSSILDGGFAAANFRLAGAPEGELYHFAYLSIDQNFLPTMRIALLAGRNFSAEVASDSSAAFLVNASAARRLGWPSPAAALGQRLHGIGKNGSIVGVVEDFHFNSLHESVSPLVLELAPAQATFLLARVAPGPVQETRHALALAWQNAAVDHPFEGFFLETALTRLYRTEQTISTLARYATVLALCIAGLGFFGLVAYTVERRTKEIGIRKVLGASVSGIVGLLSKEFILLVLIANVLAWPVAYLALQRWLQNFAYRIDLTWWVFVLAGGIALGIALLTMAAHAIKAALANPMVSLRYE